MQIDGGYISPLFITDEQNMVAELIEPHILIYENTLPDSRRMLPILETIVQTGKPFLFIGEDIDRSLLRTLVLNKQHSGMQIAAVRVRGDHERRKMVLEEVAAFTGGLVLNDDLGIEIEQITYREIGTARKVLIEKDRTTIFQGGGRTVSRRDPVPVATDESARAERSRRKPAGVNYELSDAPLVDRMRQLLLTKGARTPWDAALAVSGQAEGHGQPESKAKRLVQRYSAVFGTERDGED
jgi:chaperonin GroEL (HSP60 family)